MTDKPLPYTIVIGLETHVQLQTESKLFCGCSTKFGAPPNTQTCPICTGHPGTLPVMNARAFELALQTAVALNCQIATYTKWDRKQYYYPDLPKGYQISQYDLPFSFAGHLDISDPKGKFEPRRVRITRAHLEEDAGKSMHDEHAGRADSKIDLNRTGTPLLEIVTEPDMRSPAEAKAYLTELKLLLTYLGVSDCNMQEGSLRVDANVNLWIDVDGVTKKTPIVEIKNMNSFRAVEKAIAYEAERQYGDWQENGKQLGDPGVFKRTFGWDDVKGKTYVQREKEESADYRYFPDPDLMPVTVSPELIERAKKPPRVVRITVNQTLNFNQSVEALSELRKPSEIRKWLEETYSITPYDSDVIVNQGREFVEYFTAVSQAVGDGKTVSNWLQQDVLRVMSENNHATIAEYPVSAERLADLLKKVKAGDVDTSRGREVLQRMYDTGEEAAAAMAALGIEKVDESAQFVLCWDLVGKNNKVALEIASGKSQAAGMLVGQAKKRNPNVNPSVVRELCTQISSNPISPYYDWIKRAIHLSCKPNGEWEQVFSRLVSDPIQILEGDIGTLAQANISERRIEISVPQLERLWGMTFAYVNLYNSLCDEKAKNPTQVDIDISGYPGSFVLNWAVLQSVFSSPTTTWPDQLPRPNPFVAEKDGEPYVVHRSFLYAIAFTELHELAHFYLDHKKSDDVAVIQQQDREADQQAFRWFIKDADGLNDSFDGKVRLIGAIVGLSWLLVRYVFPNFNDSLDRTPAIRLQHVLDRHFQDNNQHFSWEFSEMIVRLFLMNQVRG